MSRKISRRRFLNLLSQFGVALSTSELLALASCRGFSKRTRSAQPSTATTAPRVTPLKPTTATTEPTATVGLTEIPPQPTTAAIIEGGDLEAMTRQAIDALGGIDRIVDPGDKVLIKPNFAALSRWSSDRNTITNGQCTKPEIVLAVADECLKAGASQVIIGEAGQDLFARWEVAVGLQGETSLLKGVARLNELYGLKVSLEWLNNSTSRWVIVPSRTEFGQIAVSSFVIDADKVISIPVLKTNHSCAVTISIKSFMGVTPIWLYGSPRIKLHQCDMGVGQCFLDVVKGIQPDLAIVDASIGAEGNAPRVAPGEGLTVDVREHLGSWLMVAGSDLVAVDSTATRIIGHEPLYVKHLREAFAQGMGELREEHIKLVGTKLPDVRMDWLPSSQSGYPQKED